MALLFLPCCSKRNPRLGDASRSFHYDWADAMTWDNPSNNAKSISLSDGEVRAWIDGGLHLKAVTTFGDPVELNSDEVRALIAGLCELLRELD